MTAAEIHADCRARHDAYKAAPPRYRVVDPTRSARRGRRLRACCEWLDALVRAGLLRRRRRASGRLNDRGMVTSVAFSPDGCTLASAGDDTIALWDIDRRTPLIRARTGTQIADLAWHADRIALATATAVACLDFVDSGEDSTTSAITARRMATFR